jgi:hypothetical protein
VKAVIRQLPQDTPAENFSNELVALSLFIVISVRQMTVTRPQPQEYHETFNIPFLLVTHNRKKKTI